MGEAEIAMIRRHLRPPHLMLEWGAGGSTVYYPQFVSAYFSVEHDPKWYGKVSKEIEQRNLAKVKLFHVPVKTDAATKLEAYHDYIYFPRSLDRRFDRILIDGRERVACAEVARELIAADGLLFVHDYVARRRYAAIEEHWLMIESIDFGQTLAVFRKKAL